MAGGPLVRLAGEGEGANALYFQKKNNPVELTLVMFFRNLVICLKSPYAMSVG